MHDIHQAAETALRNAAALVQGWLPDGRREGAEWVARNPTRSDQRPGSFKVNLDTGKWADFATGDSGGDLVGLFSYLHGCDSQHAAARELLEHFGQAPRPAKPTSDWTPITDGVPEDAPPPPEYHRHPGTPTGRWAYRAPDGRVLHYVARFDKPLETGQAKPKKDFYPLTCGRTKAGDYEWRRKSFPEPRPLFNLDCLARQPGAKVVLCEGEAKALDAGRLLPEFVPTCNSGGANATAKTDWTPLQGRSVLVWPDADQAGRQWATAVLDRLGDLGCTLAVVATEGLDATIGFDAKDALAAGWTTADVERRITPRPTQMVMQRRCAITIEPGRLPEIVDQVESVMVKYSGNFYQRAGMLVRWCVAYAETVQGITRPAGSVVILPLDPDYLLDQLNRLIEWRATLKNGEVVRANAPRQVASILLSRHGNWRAQPLIAAINAPTLRPDGSLLDREGYDARTGLLFVNAGGEAFPSIPARPTRPEAFAALANLKEVIGEFPFAAEHDRSAALSAIITATVRHALKAAPMHVLSAPRMASGKSLLADVVALVATGRTATVMSFTTDPEEMRKRVLAVLLAGDGVVSLDNIESVLTSSVLCTVLTQESFSDRLLGANKRATVPTLTFWLATGNNLQVAGDLTTQIVPCNLDPQVERPEEREFERNLYDWIPRNRARLVIAILTLLRAYVAAGLPKQNLKNFARFEDWSRLVRSALVWLGEPDPLLGLERVEDADPDRIRLRSLLLGWYAAFQGRPVTSKAAMELACPDRVRMVRTSEDSTPRSSSTLAEVLEDCFAHRKGGVTSSQIGYFLRKYAGRIEVGARFGRGGSSQRRELWRVEVLDSERFHRELYAFTTSGENPHLSSLSSLPAPSAPAPSVPEAADCANQEPVTEDPDAVEVEWEVF